MFQKGLVNSSLLAEVSHDEAKIFFFLPRRERPLLAGKVNSDFRCWDLFIIFSFEFDIVFSLSTNHGNLKIVFKFSTA